MTDIFVAEDSLVMLGFLGGVGKFVGNVAKGAAKGVVKAVKGVPVVGQVVTVAEEAVKGALGRTGGAAQAQVEGEILAQRQLSAQRTAGLAGGFTVGEIFANPVGLILVAGVVFFFISRRK